MRTYEYRHVVSFEDTNLVGNVYYVNHIRWQGRCREMFLKEHVPEILEELNGDLAMITVSVSCSFLAELSAFDEVIIRMHLANIAQNRITMHFDYWLLTGNREVLVARGEQQVACMRRNGDSLQPVQIPKGLASVLRAYAEE